MAFAEDLVDYFTGHPGLAALIGARFYLMRLPQDPTLPAVTYQKIGGTPEYSHDQGSVPEPRIQFTTWAETYSDATAVSNQVILAVDAWGLVMVGAAFVELEIDLTEPTTGIYQIVQDVWFSGVAR